MGGMSAASSRHAVCARMIRSETWSLVRTKAGLAAQASAATKPGRFELS